MKVASRNYLSTLRLQTFSGFCTTSKVNQQNEASKSTIDYQDVLNHSKHSNDWWDLHGSMKPLHSMNPLRVKFIRNGLANAGFKENNPCQPLEGVKLLDVGCGGGILSESLARMGAKVCGIDASKELLTIANEHAALDNDLSSNLTYKHTTIEDFSHDIKEQYDAVVASEILEHVINQELFLKSCTDVLKPKGSIFITTLNRNIISWLGGIVAAEYVLRLLPAGIHDWNKFITPDESKRLLEKCHCKTKLVHGLFYNPATNNWSWTSSTAINYALHAVKQENEDAKIC